MCASLLALVAMTLGCAAAVWPQKAQPQRLNSLVVEYADIDLTRQPLAAREVTCVLKDEAWLFISLQGQTATDGAARVLLESGDGQAVVLRAPGETMRRVPAGEVTVRLVAENAAGLTRLVVRRVPEVMVYMFEGLDEPSSQRWVTHSWEFLEEAILPSTNLIVSPPSDAYADHARAWQERGGRWLINQSMNPLRREGADGAAYWANVLGGTVWDGSIHDEVLNADVPLFPRYADALRRFSAMPESSGKTVYLFCGVNAIGDPTILDFFAPDDGTSAEGERSLHCLPQGEEITTTARQMEVELEPGVEHTLSVSMRTETCVPARYSGIFVIDEGWYGFYGHLPPPEGDSEWTRYETTFTPRPSSNGLYQVVVCGPSEGTMWLDAVQLERDGLATDFAPGEPNLLRNPGFEDGLQEWLRGADRVAPIREAVMELGHVFAPEVYIHEQATEEQAREVIDARLTRTVGGWRRHYPGIENHLLIVLSAGNCTMRYSNDQLPGVSYKALLDLEMHTIATDPAFEDLRGVGFWSGHYLDEEGMRWYGALFRHYCIEGSRERLYDGPYLLDHLTNPGFEDGLEGWEIAGSVEPVPVAHMPPGGARERHAPVPQGTMVVRTVRDAGEANSFSQPIRNLEPGRLYSLKVYCSDAEYSDRLIPAQITIEGGLALAGRVLGHIWQSASGETYWTLHRRVFRATAAEGHLTVSDAEPGEVYWDFVQIEPYFEGGRASGLRVPRTSGPVPDRTPGEEHADRGGDMEGTADRLETERLVIRRFTTDDWAEIQKLAIDKESSEAAKYDHRWPTTEDGCKGAADYFAKNGCFWAVCPKDSDRIIGLLSFNNIEDDGRLDLGHLFHRDFARDDLDTEAIRCIIGHAFAVLDVECIVCRNAADWTVQLSPLRKLGLRMKGQGKASFREDEDGNPIEFVGCEMEITRDEWQQRGRTHEPKPQH